MTEDSPPGSAPIVISISADVPLRILRTKNGFVIDVGDFVQIRGVSYDRVAGAGAASRTCSSRPVAAVTGDHAHGRIERAAAAYDDLAAPGRTRLGRIRRQQATQDLVEQAQATVRQARATPHRRPQGQRAHHPRGKADQDRGDQDRRGSESGRAGRGEEARRGEQPRLTGEPAGGRRPTAGATCRTSSHRRCA